VANTVGDKVNRAVQRPIFGFPEVPGCKYSRGLPSIFESRPMNLLKIVIAEEIGICQPQVWKTYNKKNGE
jgi:hypothetical protein